MSFGNSNFEKKGSGRSIDEAFDERFGLGGDDGFVPQRSKYAAKKATRRADVAVVQNAEGIQSLAGHEPFGRRRSKDRHGYCGSHIGIVKWYDRRRGLGFIVTNKLGYEDLPPTSPDPVEPRFDADGCAFQYQTPKEGDVVVYKRKGSSATDVKEFAVCSKDVLLALTYELYSPVIVGKAYNSVRIYNDNVLQCTLSSAWKNGIDPAAYRKELNGAIETLAAGTPDGIIEKLLKALLQS